jgi:hypothetical protein
MATQKQSYFAFVDPSGSSSDSFTLAIAHKEGETEILDVVRERKPPFSPEAVTEEFAKLMKSEIYVDLLPLLNSRAIDLLENERLLHQLVSLERRTSRSGNDSIDHAPKAHDDLANAAAGALVTAYKEPGFSNFNRKLPQPNIGVY